MAKPKSKEKIYLVYCLSKKHERQNEGIYFIFTGRKPEEVLTKLGCPLECGEINFEIDRGSPMPEDEFIKTAEDLAETPAYRDKITHYEEIDLGRLLKAYEDYQTPQERGLVPATTGSKAQKAPQPKPIDVNALEAYLGKWVVDQPIPRKKVVKRVRIAETGLRIRKQPAGIFLFMGPPGTGKTELVRRFCKFVLGTKEPTARLDMSEFQERHIVSRLTGAPPGYVGYGDETRLAAIEGRPRAVVLLDEFEKAHPDVWKVFLQIFDEGRLTIDVETVTTQSGQISSAEKRVLDFRNTYIFMTSNLGTKETLEFLGGGGRSLGFGPTKRNGKELDPENKIYDICIQAMKKRLPPELISRFHKVAVFQPLAGEETLNKIIDLKMEEFHTDEEEGVLKDLDLTVSLTEEAKRFIRERYDHTLGVRSILDGISTYIFDTLALGLGDGRIKPGDHVIIKKIEGASDEKWSAQNGITVDFEVKSPIQEPEKDL